MARAATKPRIYHCTREPCVKIFTTKGDMNRHIRTVHDGIKDYVCKECGDRFGQRTSLLGHQSKHTGAKPYQCTVGGCHRRFGDASSRTRHAKEVHGSHYYTCIFAHCTKTTKRKSVMDKHMKKAHGVKGTAVEAMTERAIRMKPELPDSPFSSLTSLPDDESDLGTSQDFIGATVSPSYASSPLPSFSPRIESHQIDFSRTYLSDPRFDISYDGFCEPLLYSTTEPVAYSDAQASFPGSKDVLYGGISCYTGDFIYTTLDDHYSSVSASPSTVSPSPSPGPLLCDTSSYATFSSPSSDLSCGLGSSYADWTQPPSYF